jgi:hypothetical protein
MDILFGSWDDGGEVLAMNALDRPRSGAFGLIRATYKEMDGVPMRRKGLERRSKKYAPLQNVSVVNWYMDAEDFHQKHKTRRVGVTKRMSPAAGGKGIRKELAEGMRWTGRTACARSVLFCSVSQ